MSGFVSAWNVYLCAMQGHLVEYVAATTSATPPRVWVCKRCGYRNDVSR